MKRIFLTYLTLYLCVSAFAQEAFVEMSGTTSSGQYAPLWLSSNRQGIVSPYANSAYERAGITYTQINDTSRTWQYGYGADIMLAQNAQYKFFIHQLYGELKYKKILLTIGQKEREIDLRNNTLTSGGLSQGINAQPIPEILISTDYFSIPFTRHWWKMRGRIGYGKTTDGNWQKSWVGNTETMRYTSNVLYHEKAFYWKWGKEEKFPLIFEFGLQMMTQFGGTNYNFEGRNYHDKSTIQNKEDLSAFWHALSPFNSSDTSDGTIKNVQGNTVGSWNMALTWQAREWFLRGYFERFFEDQSQMFVQYGIFDHLVGLELQLPKNHFVNNIVIEHINTKNQSGAVYHDVTTTLPEGIAGRDNYYNHIQYSGWQNWGMAIGNPLLTSPIYNNDHQLKFLNTRIKALHVGLSGSPTEELSWRILMTFTRNWGIYSSGWDPYDETHLMGEATYKPHWAYGWTGTLGLGITDGKKDYMGNTKGVQLTIRKAFAL